MLFEQPLRLAPRLDAKTWGGRRLARFGKQLPDGPIGEALESGNSARVLAGRFAGATLGELARCYPDELLGERGRAAAGTALDFPLLVKLIDAETHLSVQVHPSDAQAPAGARGKCEAWLVLEAAQGAELITGVRGTPDIAQLDAQLIRRPALPGDVLLVPPGVVHAIGAGVLLYEVQQPSDVTYRLYDWGRQRQLHVADALRVARANTEALVVQPVSLRADAELLVACPYFALERRVLTGGQLDALPSSCRVLTLLDGALSIGDVALTTGESVVLPAALPSQAVAGSGLALIAWAPDLEHDILGPLRAAGVSASAIAQVMGGEFFD
jgi:mannose-6-phosphate isomerase